MAANITNITTTPLTTTVTSVIIYKATYVIADYTLALSGISSLLSIFGAIFMYWSYAYVPEVRNYTRKLLLFLTTADLFTAIGYLIGMVHYVIVVKQEDLHRPESDDPDQADDTDSICKIQSFIVIYFNLAAYFWTMIIAAHIVVAVISGRTSRGVVVNILFHVVSWGVPVIIAGTAAGYHVLGQDNVVRPLPWCFLRSRSNHKKLIFWTMITSIAWELATYLVTAVLYMYMKYALHLRRRLNVQNGDGNMNQGIPRHQEREMTRDDRNFLFVWLILYVLKIWGTVRLFIITAHPNAYTDNYYKEVMTALLNIQSFATSGQAFWNSVIFCVFNRDVRRKLVSIWRRNETERQPLLHG